MVGWAWTWVWAWVAFLVMGLPKVAQLAEAQAAAPNVLATLGQTTGRVYCRPCDCPKGDAGGMVSAPGSEGSNPGSATCSEHPVHYFSGEVVFMSTDLVSGGFGTWGQRRDFSTLYHSAPGGEMGPGWAITQWPRLIQEFFTVHVIAGGRYYLSFNDSAGVYTPKHFYTEKLTTASGEIILTDTMGNRTTFHNFSQGAKAGLFKQYKDAAGNITDVTRGLSGVTLDKITEILRSFNDGTTTTTESWLYEYYLVPPDTGKIKKVTLQRTVNGGQTWTVARKVEYTYYLGSPNGPDGYLERAVIRDPADLQISTSYYRYYKTGNWGGGLKFAVEGPEYERAKAANGGTDAGVDAALDTGSASTIDNFAGHYLEYDTSKRVTKEVVQGAGCG